MKQGFDKLGQDYFEIRLESIGGLGANLCGKMLGELGVKYLDVNSSNFSSYGSEKTGTPVKGYIRYCDKKKEIRVHSPVVNPDILVVFHQALLRDASIWKGCNQETAVIIAAETGEDLMPGGNVNKLICDKASAEMLGKCYGLEAQTIAMETKSRINVVMLGAILKVMGLSDAAAGEKICADTLGNKYPEALAGNLEGLKRGFDEVKELQLQVKLPSQETKVEPATGKSKGKEEPYWGYKNAPIGGINPNFGNSVVSDVSPSRQGYIPLFIKERCINCGLCHSACPDMVFQFVKGEYRGKEMMINQGLDYYHCKGCLRCVDVCPVNALVRGVEAEHPMKNYFLPNQELLRNPQYYEKTGPDGYITSESYLTEKRMEGGEV